MKEDESVKNVSNDTRDAFAQEIDSNKSPEASAKNSEIKGEIEKAVDQAFEKRLNLERFLSQKFSDSENLIAEKINFEFKRINQRLWIYGILASFVIIFFTYVITFLGPGYVRSQIDKRLIDPELNKAVENLVSTKLEPLEQRIQRLDTSIQNKQRDLADVQRELGQMLEIQQLSIGARAGSRADYEGLLQLSKSEQESMRKSAEAALRDLQYYFSADRFQLTGNRTLVDPKTRSQIFFSVEELAQELVNQDPGMQEAAVNLVADSEKKYFVGHLVEMLQKEQNLRVCVRITRALEKLTNERAFEPLAFDVVASWWNQNNGKEEYAWPFHHYFDGLGSMEAGSLNEALIHFERMIEKEPQAFLSMIYKARILTLQGKNDEAEKVFKQVEDTRNDYRWLYVWRAFFFLSQNKPNEAVNSINRALEISPGLEEFIRSQSWAQPLLTNKAVKWSGQEVETKANDIQQD